MGLDISSADVIVKISNERLKTVITVTGNVCAKSAREFIGKCGTDDLSDSLIIPDITALPQGYCVNLFDLTTLREKLDDCGMVDCFQIFSICDMVLNLFKKYGKEIFADILFDYNAVFVSDGDMLKVSFLYLPFLHCDRYRIRFSEFIRMLFVHMRENDNLSERFVTELLEYVNLWENSDYDNDYLGNIVFCINAFMEYYNRDSKRDLFSKSFGALKNIVSNKNTAQNRMKDKKYIVVLTCPDKKKSYSFVFDSLQNMFYVLDNNSDKNTSGMKLLKVGRDKSWADIHIPDMYVSGKFCTILFEEGCLVAKTDCFSENNIADSFLKSNVVKLENGSQFSVGKNLYNVIIKPKNN